MSSTPSPGTCTLSFPTARPTSTSSNFLSCEIEPSADPRHVSIGCLAQPTTFTESDCSVDTERVRSIRIEVYGVSVILSFQNSTTQSTDALEYWTTSFFESFHHLCGGRIPYCFRCTTESSKPFLFVCSVLARILTFSEFEIHCSEFPLFVFSKSLNIDMKMIRSSKFSGSKFRSCKSFWIFWRNSNDASPGKKCYSNSIGSLSIPSNSLEDLDCWNSVTWIFPSSIRLWMIWHFPQA